MTLCSTYIDCFAYLRATTGLETASLIGNKGRLSSAVLAGATSLPVVPNTSVVLKQFDLITLFDSGVSEQLMVGADTAANASSIPLLQPVARAHAQYTSYCTDGASSLADEIANASSWIEDICQQSLFQQSYTSETLDIPSLNASIDNQGTLVFRPRHYPITAENGIVVESNVQDPITYDASQIVLDSQQQIVSVPWLSVVGSSAGSWNTSPPYSRKQNLFLTISYTAGYNPVPADVRDCAVLRVSALLARRQNPTGAVIIHMGKRTQSWYAGSRDAPDSLFTREAEKILGLYRRKT